MKHIYIQIFTGTDERQTLRVRLRIAIYSLRSQMTNALASLLIWSEQKTKEENERAKRSGAMFSLGVAQTYMIPSSMA